MAVPRDELAMVAGDVRQRAEAVELHLVQEVRMIERFRDAQVAHRTHGSKRRVRGLHSRTCPRVVHLPATFATITAAAAVSAGTIGGTVATHHE